MKLVQQIKLHFQDDKSDKVYEVDLCEVGINQYLVNFRYGKRGAVLRTGTKTERPVSREAAIAIYDKLVASKTKKGYVESGSPMPKPVAPVQEKESVTEALPEEANPVLKLEPIHLQRLLNALEMEIVPASSSNAATSTQPTEPKEKPSSVWGLLKKITGIDKEEGKDKISIRSSAPKGKKKPNLSRLVWRCGELRMVEAIPYLLQLKTGVSAMQDYCLAWALGRIGTPEVIDPLKRLEQLGTQKGDAALQVITRTALLENLSGQAQTTFVQSILQTMPEDLQVAIIDQDAIGIVDVIDKVLQTPEESYHLIADLYLLAQSHPVTKKALAIWLQLAPLNGGGYFRSIRQLLKSAELIEDPEMLGLIAHKIQKGKPNFQHAKWGSRYVNGKYIAIKEEIVKSDSMLAFSTISKEYFIRRFVRNLRRKGAVNDPDYVRLATGLLLFYRDTDFGEAYAKDYWSYSRDESNRWTSEKRTVHYPNHAPYPMLNFILFANSNRLEKDKAGLKWQYKTGVNPTDSIANQREEAFPELWNQQPQGLLHLLAESQCELVHEFAVKAAKENHRRILSLVDLDFAKILLSKKYKATIKYGLDLVKAKYNPQHPDRDLVLLLLTHPETEAQDLGLKLLDQQKTFFLTQTDFVAELLFVSSEKVVDWVNQTLVVQNYSDEQSTTIIGRCIAEMMAFTEEATAEERQSILVAGQHLSQHFKRQLSQIHADLIHDLLSHPLAELQVFAGKILLDYQTPVNELPEDLLLSLINGEIPELRTVGIELLGKLPDADLLQKQDLLLALCISQYAEIRQNIRPVVTRLAEKDAAFAATMVQRLAPCLLRKEQYEGRDEDLLDLLKVHLKNYLTAIPLDTTMNLLYAPRKAAHELGSHLLHHYVQEADLSIRQIVQLGSNELVTVREWVWAMYRNNSQRIRYESREAVRLMDATWEDSRDFSFDFFRSEFTKEDWTADVLVSICDSVQPMVQQFGREMITQYFKEEDGEQYLLQLSEHPSAELQQFATNYLERFAENKPDKIEDLKPYFITVLSQVNKSSVAKKRIFAFLKKEGSKDEKVAEIIGEVLSRQSATMAIGDKTRCISIMRELQVRFPQLSLPLELLDFETYPTSLQKENA